MIKIYNNFRKHFSFIDHETVNENENVFTIIVGKNGTGKSTLLSSLVYDLLDDKSRQSFSDYDNRHFKGDLQVDHKPDAIIAVSTSPFDKFPLNRFLKKTEGYHYLGLRDLVSTNFGFAYLSKIIASLIDTVLNHPEQVLSIKHVLNYLGFQDVINVHLELITSQRNLHRILEEWDDHQFLSQTRPFARSFNRRYFYIDVEDGSDSILDERKIELLKYLVYKVLTRHFPQKCELEIGPTGVIFQEPYGEFTEHLIFMLESGLLKLRNITISPIESQQSFSIKEASSGVQSVILSILGIASKIKDNAVICIDEPEICLHPEWQEKYIQILMKTFSMYKHCHFLIATHSPQIISRLSPENCFILNIESGEIRNARDYINNSVDFQLANIFNSPGYKNEYLSRIALNIFTKVGQRKKFDEDDLAKYKILENQSQFIDDADPVKQLFGAIKKLHELYA